MNVTDLKRGTTFQQTTSSTVLSLTTLRPFTSYTVRIAAYTTAGDGPYGAPIHLMTREAGT